MIRILQICFLLTFFCTASICNAQSWQWGKRGGTIDPTFDGNSEEWEQARSMVTDSQGNVYLLSPVGIEDLDIDGNPKTTYGLYGGGGGASFDYAISSFSCDGTYRWSKVIGGQKSDNMQQLQIDGQDNIYAVGVVYNEYDDFFFPGSKPQVHFDNDLILPYAVNSTEGHQSMFICKYSPEGDLLWVKWPQASNITPAETNDSGSRGLQVDMQGNSYWLCSLTPGLYVNGELNVTSGQGYYILQYDSLGNYINAILLDLQHDQSFPLNLKFRRNHNSGTYYIASTFSSSAGNMQSIIVGDQATTNSKLIAAFDSQGTFLWKKENNSVLNYAPISYAIDFDSDNNIYMIGGAGKTNLTDDPPIMESFAGMQFTASPNFALLPVPYVVKLDPTGNPVWVTNGFKNIISPFGITVDGDEVSIAGGQRGIQWGDIDIPYNNKGYDAYLAKFNKQTGAIIGIETFASNNTADDYGTSVTADLHGNYFLGGRFGSQITVGPSVLQNAGADTDFFVAKFGTDVDCQLSVEEDAALNHSIKAFPNPVRDILHVDNNTPMQYVLYDIMGRSVLQGALQVNGSIVTEGIPAGLYFLQLADQDGQKQAIKIVKQ